MLTLTAPLLLKSILTQESFPDQDKDLERLRGEIRGLTICLPCLHLLLNFGDRYPEKFKRNYTMRPLTLISYKIEARIRIEPKKILHCYLSLRVLRKWNKSSEEILPTDEANDTAKSCEEIKQ